MSVPAPARTLLAHIVDYAGTFPPASLTIEDALSTYARERSGADAWLLGRFVVAAQSLDMVSRSTEAETYMFGEVWPLSVIAGPDARAALAQVDAFKACATGRAGVASVEFSPVPLAEIASLSTLTGDGVDSFFETPIDADLCARLDAIAVAGAAAKVRTGGTTPVAIPSPTRLSDFLYECAQRRLPFKATAGLHHVVRSCYPLTYERDSETAVMYGFLNLLAATAAAIAGASRNAIADTLVQPSAHALMETAQGHDANTTRSFFRSFGSCSFREPADELARVLDDDARRQ